MYYSIEGSELYGNSPDNVGFGAKNVNLVGKGDGRKNREK